MLFVKMFSQFLQGSYVFVIPQQYYLYTIFQPGIM